MTLSASGARIQGDDYQHLLTWYHALRLLDPAAGVTRVRFEVTGAANLDDLIVERAGGDHEYYQVKYSVDGKSPITNAWFIDPGKNARSPLHQLLAGFRALRAQGHAAPRMALFTNRALDVADPLLACRDGRTSTLAERLRAAAPGSAAGKARSAWATHLGVAEAELLDLLQTFAIHADQASQLLLQATADRMAAHGLKSGDLDVEQGVVAARSWVTAGRREVDRAALLDEIERRSLRGGPRRATLAVHAIDRDPWGEAATAAVDWVDLYAGDQPAVRRRLQDPAGWMERLWPELLAAERGVRAQGHDRVVVRGYMRLPTWFAVGVAFGDRRGFQVSCVQRGGLWSTETTPSAMPVQVTAQDLELGDELAVGLSVAQDLSADVLSYVRKEALPVRRFVHVAPAAGAGNTAMADDAAARAWALEVKRILGDQVRETGAGRLHLFLAVPAGAALMLGHAWNRLPATRIYEDLAPEYGPTFLIDG